jgi:hypothetical protein
MLVTESKDMNNEFLGRRRLQLGLEVHRAITSAEIARNNHDHQPSPAYRWTASRLPQRPRAANPESAKIILTITRTQKI